MTLWQPEWRLSVDGGEYTSVALANLSIVGGRTDIYQQPIAGYCRVQIINLEQTPITIALNNQVSIQLKDSSGTWVSVFGGSITDRTISVQTAGSNTINQIIEITALGALARLPKSITNGVLAKAFDGDQIYTLLSGVLLSTWNMAPASLTWAAYNPTEDWHEALNTGLGDIDRPGDYEMDARDSNPDTIYNIASFIANSGLGYLYEDKQGRICYADSTHRSEYLAAHGYIDLTANDAIANNLAVTSKIGDVRNKVTINYKKDQSSHYSAQDTTSIGLYGEQGQVIDTTLDKLVDATAQADHYLKLRAYPQDNFSSITFQLANSNISDEDRDALIGTFMGMPVNIVDLPSNMVGGAFQGFVEGWTFTATYNALALTLYVSPIAYSLQAFRWNGVPITENWNTLNPTMDWLNATIVS